MNLGEDGDASGLGPEGGHRIIAEDVINLLDNNGRFGIPSHRGDVPIIPPIPPSTSAHIGAGDSTTSSGDIALVKQEQLMAWQRALDAVDMAAKR